MSSSSRRARLRRRRRRRVALAVGGLAFVLLVLAGVAYQTLQRERAQLVVLTGDIRQLVGDPAVLREPAARAEAVATLRQAQERLTSSRSRLDRAVSLRILGVLPVARRQRAGLLQVLADGVVAADTAADALEAVDGATQTAQVVDGRLPLDAMADLRQVAARSGDRMSGLVRGTNGLIGPLGHARRELDDTAREQGQRLTRLGEQMRAAESFFGAGSPRRYFLALENNAEMRARGMVLSFAELVFDDGAARVGRTASVSEIGLDRPAAVDLPPGIVTAFGGLEPTRIWQSVNATADFELTGRSIQAMYRDAAGVAVDGVIGIDVPGLEHLLRVVGPIDVEGVDEQITADNLARIVLNDFYADLPFGPQEARRERLADVAAAVTARLTAGGYDVVALAEAISAAASERHLRIWSADDAEERAFVEAGIAGGVAGSDADRTFHIAVQNATATKLDYFVRPSVSMEVILTPAGNAVVRTTVTVANNAPADAGSSYQFGPDRINSFRPAEYVTRIHLWSPHGSTQLGAVEESGLALVQIPTSALPGTTTTVRFETIIDDAVRDGVLELRLVPQPRLEPVPLQVTLQAPGRRIDGPATLTPDWSRDVTVSWRIR